MCLDKTDLTAFIDESGSITKTDIEHHQYFIIEILFTKNSKRIKRYFKKGIASLMQNEKYKKKLYCLSCFFDRYLSFSGELCGCQGQYAG